MKHFPRFQALVQFSEAQIFCSMLFEGLGWLRLGGRTGSGSLLAIFFAQDLARLSETTALGVGCAFAMRSFSL
jgi:hypothetical protein